MNRNLSIMLILNLFLFMGSSDKSNIKRLIKIEEHTYSGNETYHTNYDFYYNGILLDSIEVDHLDNINKDVFRYSYDSTNVKVYRYMSRYDTLFKEDEYDFDSIGRLIKFTGYSNNKIVTEDKYYYDKFKLIKVLSIKRPYWVDGEYFSELIYSINDFYNIDTIYEYSIDNNMKDLYSIKIFKHDKKPNPFKGLLYFGISESYFNTNNIIKTYFLNDSLKIRDSIIYNYSFDNENYLIKKYDDDIFESDSIIQNYFYKN